MNKPIRIKIDVSKIDKDAIFHGKNRAKYLDLVAWPVKESKYGETHSVKQDFGKNDPRNRECPFVGSLTLPGEQPVEQRHPDPHGRNRDAYQPSRYSTPQQAVQPAHLSNSDETDDIPF